MDVLTFLRSLGRIMAGRPRIPVALNDNAMLRTILERRSVRSFTRQPIADDAFSAILEAGRLAPSTVNLQSWTFSVHDAASWQAAFSRPIPFKAQRAVIVMGDFHRIRGVITDFAESPLVDYTTAVMNASLAAMAMNLAAEALGVASVMLSETGRTGLLDAGYLKGVLCLPEQVFPIMTIVFGYPARAYPPMPPKLSLETICMDGQYREPDAQTMRDWLDEMKAGYKTEHLNSSFDAQLRLYERKLARAESDLQRMIYFKSAGQPANNLPPDAG